MNKKNRIFTIVQNGYLAQRNKSNKQETVLTDIVGDWARSVLSNVINFISNKMNGFTGESNE